MNNPAASNNEALRLNQLHSSIAITFGEFAEVTNLGDFEDSLTEMIEIIRLRPKCASAENFGRDRLFPRVLFPPTVHTYLKRGDVFLVTMGLRKGEWHIVAMSPPYENQAL